MPTIQTQPGDTLSTLADRTFNGDVLRFPEILDLNPEFNVFSELPPSANLNIPDPAQILNYAKPALSRVSKAIGGAGRYLSEVERVINQVSGALPPELQGYAQEALGIVGKVNGIVGDVEQTLNNDALDGQLRHYEGQLVSLVPWLLNGR